MTGVTIREYWHNISAFFRVPVQHGLFTSNNLIKFEKLVKTSHHLRLISDEGKKLNFLVKKYSQQTHF
jgi:hypothetical protein